MQFDRAASKADTWKKKYTDWSVFMSLSEKALATRQRILTAASALFYLHGYHATGLDKVIRRAGVTKGNFYYHFPSKEALAIASLDWQFSRISREIQEQVLDRSDTSLDALFALLESMAARQKQQHQEGQICGCYFGNFSLELSTASQETAAKVNEVFSRLQALIESLLVKAVAAGQISRELDPARFAAIVLGQIEGAILLDKARQTPTQLDASIDFIKDYLSGC